jgi:hypothetical protein
VASELFEGVIHWFGNEKRIIVHATESEDALLGTKMLRGYLFESDIEENKVAISEK